MATIYMKITPPLGDAWFASCWKPANLTPEQTLTMVRRNAQKRGVDVAYDLATEADYHAYRDNVQKQLRGGV